MTISNFIYCYHTDTLFHLPVTPETLPNTYQSKFSLEEVMNRTAPKAVFSGSGPRTLVVSLDIHQQLFALDNPGNPSITKDLVKTLVSCAYPDYDLENMKIKQPMVLMKFGEACTIRGVITSGVTCEYSGPWLKDGTRAMAKINFTITEVDQYSASFIQQFGSNVPLPTDLDRSRIG